MMNQHYSNGCDDDRIREALLQQIREVENKMIAHMFTYNRILDLHNDEAFRAFREGRDNDVITILARMEQMIHVINAALPDELPIPSQLVREPDILSNQGVDELFIAAFTEAWNPPQLSD